MTIFLEGRLFIPGMLLIGAAGRKVGKTELACQFIGRSSLTVPVIGLKVTAVDSTDGDCPRGGKGCGVCSSLTTPWSLFMEDNASTGKDTSRLLAAGAHQVYWLRVLKTHLAEGALEMLKTIGPDAVIICESNSLRQVVEPGLFLQVRSADKVSLKSSARLVTHLADAIVVSNGKDFDLPLDRVTLVDGQWALFRQACAIIVVTAEGHHRGEADARVSTVESRVRGIVSSLRPQFSSILICTHEPARFAHLDLPLIVTKQGQDGAIPAFADVLDQSPHEWYFAVSSDYSAAPAGTVNALFRRSAGLDAVIPVDAGVQRHPLFVLLHRRYFQAAAKAGRWSVDSESISDLGDHYRIGRLALGPGMFSPSPGLSN